MSRKFWQIENVLLESGVLQISMIELTSAPSDMASPAAIAGVVITGQSLMVRPNSEHLTVTFPKIVEFRAVPEQCSWPTYEDGIELIPCFLYEKSGLFFYGKSCPQDYKSFDTNLGWCYAKDLQCYVVHSESFDIYVLTNQPPSIK
jgi:hypothetical protein